MMKGGIGNLLRQAQQMQETMQKAQAELADIEVTGEAGAGMVKLVLNGRHEAKSIAIEPKLLGEDKDMLEDLVVAAINDAVRKVAARTQEKYSGLMSGLNLPPRHEVAVLKYTPVLARLIEALRCLPGVGPKSAQRMAFHLLERDRDGGRLLGAALAEALASIGHCKRCRMLTESELCVICASPQRNVAQLCVVESPADVVAIEQSGSFRGRYFVLMGHLSPLDGVGPAELGLDEFEQLLGGGDVTEVILATNPTVEGEATAHYLGELALRLGIKASRIAHGVPVGGELEYVDGGTLAHALAGRTAVS